MEIVEEAQMTFNSRIQTFFRRDKPDNSPIQLNTKIVNRDSDYLKKILQTVQPRSYKPDTKLTEATTQYASVIQQETPLSLLGNSLSEISTIFKAIDQLQTKMDEFITKNFAEPIKQFGNKEINGAQQARKNYEYAEKEYEVKLNTVNQMKKKGTIQSGTIQRAEAELLTLKLTCEQTELDARYKLQDSVDKNVFETSLEICDLFDGYRNFFASSLEILDKSMNKFKTIRTQAAEQRRDFVQRVAKRPPLNVLKPNQQKTPRYGLPLEQVFRLETVYTSIGPIPSFLQLLIAQIYNHHLKQEGLFRISPHHEALRAHKIAIDQGLKLDLSKEDGHLLSALITTWLRDLPDPLCGLLPETLENNAESLTKFVNDLPNNNRAILQQILHLMNHVAAKSEFNKMSISSLSIILGPNLFASPTLDINFFERSNKLAEGLLENYQHIFKVSPQTRIHDIIECRGPAPAPVAPPAPLTVPPSNVGINPPPEPANSRLVGFFANKFGRATPPSSQSVAVLETDDLLKSEEEKESFASDFGSNYSQSDPSADTPANISTSPRGPTVGTLDVGGAKAPNWQNDVNIKNCSLCNQAFNLVSRKHHCRSCGRIVCANCSSQRVDIPQWNMKGVRVCPKCANDKNSSQTFLE